MCSPVNCPLHTTAENHKLKHAHLQQASCMLTVEGTRSPSQMETEYFLAGICLTHESVGGPLVPGCFTLPDEQWYHNRGLQQSVPAFRPDGAPPYMHMLISHNFGHVGFH